MSSNIKNKRFKEGGLVDIYHSPVYYGRTVDIEDGVNPLGIFQIKATLGSDISAEMFGVGDIASFEYGTGTISEKGDDYVVVDFSNSVAPNDKIRVYTNRNHQNILFFLSNDSYIAKSFTVDRYIEDADDAYFGKGYEVYNIEHSYSILLSPTIRINDGVLSAIMNSRNFVLKSCNDSTSYTSGGWDDSFDITFKGIEISPIYMRGYLKQRKIASRHYKSVATFEFNLV